MMMEQLVIELPILFSITSKAILSNSGMFIIFFNQESPNQNFAQNPIILAVLFGIMEE
jgi:hypothetical protein